MTGETYSTEGPQCPYCGRQYTANDASYYDESNYTSQECDGCGKTFSVEVFTQTSWTCEPIGPKRPEC